MKYIFAIHGLIGSGKDEAGKQIARAMKDSALHVFNQRFAERLKQFASICFNIPLQIVDRDSYSQPVWDFTREQKSQIIPHYTEKNGDPMTLGRFLQLFATETVRENWDNDFWYNCCLDHIRNKGLFPDGSVHVITDLRFPNELKRLSEERDDVAVITLYIDRPDNEGGDMGGRKEDHKSEDGLDQKAFVKTIVNDSSLEAFQTTVYDYAYSVAQQIAQQDGESEDANG